MFEKAALCPSAAFLVCGVSEWAPDQVRGYGLIVALSLLLGDGALDHLLE